MSGQESPSSSHSAQDPPALEIDGVSKFYGHYPALKQIKLNIERGSTVALLGRNGAGKTTLVKMLLGQLKPTAGNIKFGTKLEVVYFDQMREQINDNLTVAENITHRQNSILQ